MIQSLKSNQVFVFGSNLAGKHFGGAARQAEEQFGAVMGVGEGMAGQCYAFPTLGKHFEQLSDPKLRMYADRFKKCAKENPDKEFLLTKVGTGIAGYTEEYMNHLLKDLPDNVTRV